MRQTIAALFALLAFMATGKATAKHRVEALPTAKYTITIDNNNPSFVDVEATFLISDGMLNMDPGEIWFLPDVESWWELIEIQELRTTNGEPVSIQRIDKHQAILDRASPISLYVRYRANISFIDQHLPYGNTAAGARFVDSFFVVGKALFIYPGSDANYEIQMAPISGLKISTPWKKKRNTYRVRNSRELTKSILAVGDFNLEKIRTRKLDYKIAIFPGAFEYNEPAQVTAGAVARYYVSNFPLENTDSYLQVIYPARYISGEAYSRSSVFSVREGEAANYEWKLSLAHELFHLWNPWQITGAREPDLEWFKEGFANYFSEKALLESNVISSADATEIAQKHYLAYQAALEAAPDGVSILSSGQNKGEYGRLVYDGGWVLASWLNQSIQTASDGDKSIVDLMQIILLEHGVAREPLDTAHLISLVGEISPQIARELKENLEGATLIALEEITPLDTR